MYLTCRKMIFQLTSNWDGKISKWNAKLKKNILLVIILALSFGGQFLEGENKLNYIGGLPFLWNSDVISHKILVMFMGLNGMGNHVHILGLAIATFIHQLHMGKEVFNFEHLTKYCFTC